MSDKEQKNQVDAAVDQAVGEAKVDLAKTTGNATLETEGRVQQAQGEMREGLNDAQQDVDEAARDAQDALHR